MSVGIPNCGKRHPFNGYRGVTRSPVYAPSDSAGTLMSYSSNYQLPVGCAFSHCPLLGLFWHAPGLEPLLAQLGSTLLPDLYQNKALLQLPCRAMVVVRFYFIKTLLQSEKIYDSATYPEPKKRVSRSVEMST